MLAPRTLLTAVGATVAFLACGAFAWDASRHDVIADGVRIGAVDVGGLSREQARARLQRRLVAPLRTTLVVVAADLEFPLSAREAKLEADVDEMVDEALQRSRRGGAIGRAWRAVSGQGTALRLAAQITYSREAVQRIVDRARVAVTRRPVDAKLDFAPSSLSIRPARSGRTIDARRLRERIEKALVSPTAQRRLTMPVTRLKPKLTGDELARKYPVVLAVDRGNYRITLFKKLEKVKSYPIAVGQAGLETPAGLYTIQNKAINPAWHVPNSPWAGSLAGQVIPGGAPNNPLKARWLGVYDGVGVHGTDARGSIGTNASHGCIRMLVEDVTALYDQVPVGTPIYIH